MNKTTPYLICMQTFFGLAWENFDPLTKKRIQIQETVEVG